MKFDENCIKVPRTVEIIQNLIPRQYNHAFFSALTPDSHVTGHNGPTNKKLRIHLPLVGVEGSCIRVGDETRNNKLGECLIFDDSFNHEAWHKGDQTRLVLIFDIWHPDLSDEEVKFFSLLQKAKLKGERKYTEQTGGEDNLWSII
jgi:aspartate beta-hydroxylase